MARYRIKQRPSLLVHGAAVFEVEERHRFGWEYRNLFFTLEDAEEYIAQLRSTKPLKCKIIKEYD